MFQNHALTRHAEVRMCQRGLKDDDLELILSAASQVSGDAYLLTDQDAAREIIRRKREIQQLERLKGYKVVVENGAVITCYRSRKSDQRKTLRKGREANVKFS